MRVNCRKCSRPISVTDVIQSSNGRLQHLDCARSGGLTTEERALLFVYCSEHTVARCLSCDRDFRMTQLAADLFDGRTILCPRCRADLTENVRGHLFTCVTLPSEIRQRTQDVRDAAQRLIKQSRQTIERSDVLIREAEAHLQERQQALRAAMARRAGNNK
jgi:hypothetical protein